MDETPPPDPAGHPGEVFAAFFRQGLTAFGGTAAQANALRREFVERRGWLSETAFADLFAMAQFLPGPSASALGMAIGLRRAGLSGLLAAGLGFALPAAAAMVGLAYLLPNLDVGWGDGVVHGLKLAAAALIAQAVVAMARPLAGDPIRAGIALGATAGLLVAHGPVAQIMVLSAGAVFGLAFVRTDTAKAPDDPGRPALPPEASMAALVLFALALGLLPFLAGLLDQPMLGLASVAYRTGALAFGDGQALLPLFHGEVVGRGWMERDTLLAGYGALNALPGPSLGFAGFVGTSQAGAGGGWAAGVVALVAVYAPSILLVAGVAPFWDRLKLRPTAAGAVAGVNAAALGLLAAALWSPALAGAIERPSDWLLAVGAFVFLAVARLPAWIVVVGFAAAMGLFHPTEIGT
jgi:chromate transporter